MIRNPEMGQLLSDWLACFPRLGRIDRISLVSGALGTRIKYSKEAIYDCWWFSAYQACCLDVTCLLVTVLGCMQYFTESTRFLTQTAQLSRSMQSAHRWFLVVHPRTLADHLFVDYSSFLVFWMSVKLFPLSFFANLSCFQEVRRIFSFPLTLFNKGSFEILTPKKNDQCYIFE